MVKSLVNRMKIEQKYNDNNNNNNKHANCQLWPHWYKLTNVLPDLQVY